MESNGIAPERIEFARNPQLGRYELSVDGEVASYASFHDQGATVVFPHTVTIPRYRGNALAEQVVRFALDDVRVQGKRVVASCWFVAEFLDDHPEYAKLVARG